MAIIFAEKWRSITRYEGSQVSKKYQAKFTQNSPRNVPQASRLRKISKMPGDS
jgi:hypothetical protein